MSMLEFREMTRRIGIKDMDAIFYYSKTNPDECIDILILLDDHDTLRISNFLDKDRVVGVFLNVVYDRSEVIELEVEQSYGDGFDNLNESSGGGVHGFEGVEIESENEVGAIDGIWGWGLMKTWMRKTTG